MCSPTSIQTLLAVAAALTLFSVRAERTSNSFFTIEGEGVRIASDGGVCVDAGASGPVTLTARSGWLVNGRESIVYLSPKGLSSGLILTSKLGEDHSCSPPPPTKEDKHDTTFVLEAAANPANLIKMYALPNTSVVVTASAESSLVEKGKHKVTTTWQEWTCPVCGAHQEGRTEVRYYDVEPDTYEWTAEAVGVTQASSTWTGTMSKGLDQQIEFTVTGKRNSCQECEATATATATADVHELSVERPDYLGLDRTDAGLSNWAVTNATARIDPEPTSATYNWTSCGKCQFVGATNEQKVTYGITNSAAASTKFRAEDLKVRATASNADGLSASATCTTNFTVVAVDVEIGGVGEDKEESEGAFVQYVADTNGLMTAEGTNKMVAVSFSCEPELHTNETVSITAPEGALYARLNGKYYAMPGEFDFPAQLLRDVEFFLHGHDESSTMTDKVVAVTHRPSGAKDVAKYTSVKLRVTNIKFNHDTSSSSKDAINIRRSCAKGIDISNGEWIDSGDIVTNEPFCYTTNRAVTVKARFEASGFITSAVIRATCAGAGGSLSSLLPTNVVFAGGVSSPEYVEFSMTNRTLSCIDRSGGGVLDWSADSINEQSGCDMNNSGPHLVYTILGEPKPPWDNKYGEHENAWTNALEFAIVKAGAQGKSTDKDALAAITKYLHSGHGLVYDTVSGSSRYWITNSFSATAYINVTNSASATNFVNCYDQAYGVATIGNLLGPTTAVVPWHTEPFGYINTTNLVGVGTCNNPFYNMTIQNIYVKDVSAAGSVFFGNCMPPTDLVCSVNDKTRTWFLRHKYVVLDVGGVDYVFDACAGPFCGESTRIDYLNRAIDRSTQEEELLSFYTSLRMPNFLFKNGKRDYSEKASFPIH